MAGSVRQGSKIMEKNMKLSLKSLLLMAALAASNCGAMQQQQGPAIQVPVYIAEDLAEDRDPNQPAMQIPLQGSGSTDLEDPQEATARMIRKHRLNRLWSAGIETSIAVACSLLGANICRYAIARAEFERSWYAIAQTKFERSGAYDLSLLISLGGYVFSSGCSSINVLKKSLPRMIDSRRPMIDRAMEACFSAATLGAAGLFCYRLRCTN